LPDNDAPHHANAPDLAAEMAAALEAARAAGEIGLARLHQKVRVQRKADGSPVTEVDLAIDALLRERLLSTFPEDGWLSEEGEKGCHWLSCHRAWIVDPLDGTSGYLRGEPYWCIAIALLIDHAPVLGVLHAPALGRTWHAAAGRGAFCDDAPIHVSDRARLAGARIIGPAAIRKARCWDASWPEVTVRRYPSLALRMAFVADGTADAMLAPGRKNTWDVAAGDILVREAGGRVADASGRPLRYDDETAKVNGVVAAGEGLFGEVLARVKGFRCGGRHGHVHGRGMA